ncbi:MAG: hypothetical protein H6Q89_5529 [Myxococcaceae bacterium]|nr:hypothetical protein [Myxococcaceae bacterium]
MAIQRSKKTTAERQDRIEKQIDYSVEPAKRLKKKLPIPEKYDPRSRVQPSKQKHPPRAPGP